MRVARSGLLASVRRMPPDLALDTPLLVVWPATVQSPAGKTRKAKVFVYADHAYVYEQFARSPQLVMDAPIVSYAPSAKPAPTPQAPAIVVTEGGEQWVIFRQGCTCSGGALAAFTPAGPARSGT